MSKHDKDRLIADFQALLDGQPKESPAASIDDPRLNSYRAIPETANAVLNHFCGLTPLFGDDLFYAVAIKDDVAHVGLWSPDLKLDLSGKYLISYGRDPRRTVVLELGPRLDSRSEVLKVEITDAESGEIQGRVPFGATLQKYRCRTTEISEDKVPDQLVEIEMRETPDVVYLTQHLHYLLHGQELGLDPRIAHKSMLQTKTKYFSEMKRLWAQRRDAILGSAKPQATLFLKIKPTPPLTNAEVQQLLNAVLKKD